MNPLTTLVHSNPNSASSLSPIHSKMWSGFWKKQQVSHHQTDDLETDYIIFFPLLLVSDFMQILWGMKINYNWNCKFIWISRLVGVSVLLVHVILCELPTDALVFLHQDVASYSITMKWQSTRAKFLKTICISTYISWPFDILGTELHTHKLTLSIMLNGNLWTVPSKVMLWWPCIGNVS